MIKHKAFVKEINGTSLRAVILNHSACAGCHAGNSCTMADVKEKEIEICDYKGDYVPGQEVSVILQESMGFKALLYGYLLPFILILVVLISLYAITGNELAAGLSSVAVLIPYYIILYFYRGHLKNIFKFELEESI